MERLNERAELMGRMLDTIGAMSKVPTDFNSANKVRSAALRCISCQESENCRKWLDDHPDGAERPLAQCPNAELFNSWLDG
ncbi:hypothetical protein FMN50_04600 [Rhodobacterales bacterium]|nr:hypothetical protein FMN50_04600 [Rhodobacterales bacterium]